MRPQVRRRRTSSGARPAASGCLMREPWRSLRDPRPWGYPGTLLRAAAMCSRALALAALAAAGCAAQSEPRLSAGGSHEACTQQPLGGGAAVTGSTPAAAASRSPRRPAAVGMGPGNATAARAAAPGRRLPNIAFFLADGAAPPPPPAPSISALMWHCL